MTTMTKGDDFQKRKPLGDESFNQILEKVNAKAEDRDEQLRLLTERVLLDLIQSLSKKTQQFKISPCQIPKRKRSNSNEKAPMKKRKTSSPDPGSNFDFIEEKAASASAFGKIRKVEVCELKKKKEKKQVTRVPSLPILSPPAEMQAEFKEKIESLHGYQVKFVMHKRIWDTDLSRHHDRLSLPVNQVYNKEFLGEYKGRLEKSGSMRVKVIDPLLKEYELGLARWNSRSSFSYVLHSGWFKIALDETIKLEKGDIIQVWSFQVDNPNSFCVALVKVPKDDNAVKIEAAVESSMSKKKDANSQPQEAPESSLMSNVIQEGVESSVNKNKPIIAGMKHVNLKFGSIGIARVDLPVSV